MSAVLHHQIRQPGGDVLLRHTGLDLPANLLQRLFRNALGGGEAANLLFILHGAQILHQVAGAHHVRLQLGGQVIIRRYGEVGVLIAHRLDALGGKHVVDAHGKGPLGADLLGDSGVADGLARRLGVAGVGEIPASLAGDEGHALPHEAGGIEAVGIGGQQNGGQVAQGLADTCNVIHGLFLLSQGLKGPL